MVATDNVNNRVKRHRAALRAAGLRPIQIWVPDTRQPGFAEEARRQCATVAAADARDQGLQDFMDAALLDLGDECDA
ncbi:MAG: antitoxin MazE family protein [Pseudomonadota bacterium]